MGARNAGRLIGTVLRLKVPVGQFIFIDSLDVFKTVHRRRPCRRVYRGSIPGPGATCNGDGLTTRHCLSDVNGGFPCVVLHPANMCNPERGSCFLVTRDVERRISFTMKFGHRSVAFICIRSIIRTIFLTLSRNVGNEGCFLDSNRICRSRTFDSLVRGRLNGP